LAQLDEKKETDSMEEKADFSKQNGTTEKFGVNEAKPIVGVEADKAAAPDAAADDGPRGGLKLLAPFAFANLAGGVALVRATFFSWHFCGISQLIFVLHFLGIYGIFGIFSKSPPQGSTDPVAARIRLGAAGPGGPVHGGAVAPGICGCHPLAKCPVCAGAVAGGLSGRGE